MATAIALGQADVTTAEGDFKDVSVSTRNNTLTLRAGAEVVLEREGVTRVEQLARRRWRIHFGPDDATVSIEQDCGCGGGRRNRG